jgi:hypothetical protein
MRFRLIVKGTPEQAVEAASRWGISFTPSGGCDPPTPNGIPYTYGWAESEWGALARWLCADSDRIPYPVGSLLHYVPEPEPPGRKTRFVPGLEPRA